MNTFNIKKNIGNILTPLMKLLFRILQPLGIHIVRNHYYEPVPDTRELKSKAWRKLSQLVGIDMNEASQLKMLKSIFPKFLSECNFPTRSTGSPFEFHLGNNRFEALDAEVLYSFIRHFKPRRIIEIGSGFSTLVSAKAAINNQQNDSFNTELFCVEPYPNNIIQQGFPGLTKVIPEKVENTDLSIFKDLTENDILFIDSSHVVKTCSDVLHEYLEILPRLNPGVIIHIHDIFMPSEYPKEWILDQHTFWTEQYLLQAFLAFNDSFEVIWASSYMSLKHKDELEKVFPSWKGSYTRLPEKFKKHAVTKDGENVWPVSFWLRKIK